MGLLIAPIVLGTAFLVAPRIQFPDEYADALAFAGGVLVPMSALWLLSLAKPPRNTQVAAGIAGALAFGVLAVTGWQSWLAATLLGSTLIALGHLVGSAIGWRVESPGHLLPASVVAAAVDIVSVVHPRGLSQAIGESERALGLLTVSFPVPGTDAYAPVLGIGDLLFTALVLGAAGRHGLRRGRIVLFIIAAIGVAGLLSAVLQRAVPALPMIGAAVVLGVPEMRRLRQRDRKGAVIFMVGAVALGAGVILSRFIGPSE